MSPSISMGQDAMHLGVGLLEALARFPGLKNHTWLPQWTAETYISIVAGSLAEQHRSGQRSLESSVSV